MSANNVHKHFQFNYEPGCHVRAEYFDGPRAIVTRNRWTLVTESSVKKKKHQQENLTHTLRRAASFYLVEKSCFGRGCALSPPTRNSSSGVLETDTGTLARRAVGLLGPPKSRPAVGSTVLIGPLSVPGSNDKKGHRSPCSVCTFWWCGSIISLRSCRTETKQ